MDSTHADTRGSAPVPDDGPTPVAGIEQDTTNDTDDTTEATTPEPDDTGPDDTDLDDLPDAPDDPFAGIEDQVPDTGWAAREEYLSVRSFTPVRHVLVQHIPGSPVRPSTLGQLVSARQPRALLLYLLLLACEHRLRSNRRLPILTWARMLTTAHFPCTAAQARKAITVLEDHDLVRAQWTGTTVALVPCYENGSGEVWDQPTGEDCDPDLQRYFSLPNRFFHNEVLDQLRLPGIALLLVALKETSAEATFTISVERYSDWYGMSERTAERGYRELAAAGLTRTHRQMIKDSRAPRGLRTVYHRTLLGEFATQARADARRRAQDTVRATAAKAAAKTKPKKKRKKTKVAATSSTPASASAR